MFEKVCPHCESHDILFDYNTDIYTCNDCGLNFTEAEHRQMIEDMDELKIYCVNI
jgi:transcription initiation factor TFIIIB Brf1 subunit/transcription initiation factor TFIIB